MKLTKTKSFVRNNIVAKFLYNSKISLLLLLSPDQFLHSWLDAIEDKSYELDVNQLNFDMPSLI